MHKLPEDVVVRQGQPTSALYFLSNGSCRVTLNDFSGRKKEVCTLQTGNVFGEISYLLKCPRTATVRCIEYVSLLYTVTVEGMNFPKLLALLR